MVRSTATIFFDLPYREEGTVHRDELMDRYGFKTQRSLRDQVSYERNELHLPILNEGDQYFRSDDPKDYRKCIRKIMRMGWNTVKTGRSLYKLMPDDSGQITFEEYFSELIKEFAEETELEGVDSGQKEKTI